MSESPAHIYYFYASEYSVSALILTIFTLSLGVFFLSGKKKSSATLHLAISFLYFTLVHIAHSVSHLSLNPLFVYHRWVVAVAVLLAYAHLCVFLLKYPADMNKKIAKVFLVVAYSTTIGMLIYYIAHTYHAAIAYNFNGQAWYFNTYRLIFFWGYFVSTYNLLWYMIIGFRVFQLRQKSWPLILVIIFPSLLIFPLSTFLNLFSQLGFIPRELYILVGGIAHIFGLYLMSLLYLNVIKEPFSLLGRIVSVSMITFLTIFLVVTHVFFKKFDYHYRQEKICSLKRELSSHFAATTAAYVNQYSLISNSVRLLHQKDDDVPSELSTTSLYRNTILYDKLQHFSGKLRAHDLEDIISKGDVFFSGYARLIKEKYNSLSDDVDKRYQLLRSIDRLQYYIGFNRSKISNISDSNFRRELKEYLETTDDLFLPFRRSMEDYLSSATSEREVLKKEVLQMLAPMLPSESRIYRKEKTTTFYEAYLLYDNAAEKIYEVGFPYAVYRDYMHYPAAQISVFIIGVVLFTIFGYALFFYRTLYRPLHVLLEGVTHVIQGKMSFHAPVVSEDEIGVLTRNFNRMVQKLKANREKIIQSEKKYRELMDLLPDIIYETDLTLKITYLNRAGYFMTGYTKDDLSNKLTFADLLHKDDFEELHAFITHAIKTHNAVFSKTHIVKKKDPHEQLVGENRAVLVFENKTPIALRGIIRDVTEKVKTEETLLQIQKMETIGTLAGGLAHDFNNVLSGITGPLSLIQYSLHNENKVNKDELGTYLQMIEESSIRAADMVQQLLSLAHKDSIILVPVDLGKALKHVAKICKTAFDKSIQISTQIPDGDIMIEADPSQIEQAILNICINASHAMTIMRKKDEPQGGKLTMNIEKIVADEAFCLSHPEAREITYWYLLISDTGVGMNKKSLAKIFVPFYTTKQKGQGTGLGLAMVYHIVHNHKGFVDVYSEPGVGTTFHLYFPASKHSPAELVQSRMKIIKGEGTILVVDDEELIRMTAQSILERIGYHVLLAQNGKEAVEIFRKHQDRIKAILMDIVMPQMSGEEAAREIISISRDVPILLASGLRNDERVERAMQMGVCDFIQKPYNFEKLARAMNLLLAEKNK